MKKILITEDEKSRILGLHQNAIKKEFLTEQLAGAGEPEDLNLGTTPDATTPTTTPGTTTATTPTTTPTTPSQGLFANDRDYDYKKEGDKYFFKLKANPQTPKLQTLAKQGKFMNWTEATGKSLEAIKKLNFSSEQVNTKPLTQIKVAGMAATGLAGVSTTGSTTGTTTGGGGTPDQTLKTQFPNIGSLSSDLQTKIATWSKSPAGQYILNTPADQREKAMDNLDRLFGGDPLTKELKKPIRQALGMKADTLLGRVGSALKGGVEGVKQGFNKQTT